MPRIITIEEQAENIALFVLSVVDYVTAVEVQFVPVSGYVPERKASTRVSVRSVPAGFVTVGDVNYVTEKVTEGRNKGWLHIHRIEADGSTTDLGFGDEHVAERRKVIRAAKKAVSA